MTGADDADGGGTGSDPGRDRETRDTIAAAVPAVGAVVVHDDRVLLVHDRARDAWSVPFGRVEPGESVVTTARREVREEAAVTVRVERVAGIYSDPETQVFEHRSGRRLHFVTTLLVCSVTGESLPDPDPTPDGEEVDGARFVAVADRPPAPPTSEWVRAALADESVELT